MRTRLALAIMLLALTLPAVTTLPPGTNDLTAFRFLMESRTENHLYYLSGKVERMEHEMERLEVAILAISILVVSTLLSAGLLAARDHFRARKQPLSAYAVPDGSRVSAKV